MLPTARFFATPDELRAWFAAHHATERELWVGFHKAHTGRTGVDYLAAVDEALCFGWIDTTVRRLDDRRYAHRFTPRRAGSRWSEVNRAKFARLKRAGRVAPAGERAFAERREDRPYSYERDRAELAPDQLARLRADAAAWRYFSAQPPSFQRLAAHWVTSAARPATRDRRLAELLRTAAAGTRPRPFLVARADRARLPARRRRARR